MKDESSLTAADVMKLKASAESFITELSISHQKIEELLLQFYKDTGLTEESPLEEKAMKLAWWLVRSRGNRKGIFKYSDGYNYVGELSHYDVNKLLQDGSANCFALHTLYMIMGRMIGLPVIWLSGEASSQCIVKITDDRYIFVELAEMQDDDVTQVITGQEKREKYSNTRSDDYFIKNVKLRRIPTLRRDEPKADIEKTGRNHDKVHKRKKQDDGKHANGQEIVRALEESKEKNRKSRSKTDELADLFKPNREQAKMISKVKDSHITYKPTDPNSRINRDDDQSEPAGIATAKKEEVKGISHGSKFLSAEFHDRRNTATIRLNEQTNNDLVKSILSSNASPEDKVKQLYDDEPLWNILISAVIYKISENRPSFDHRLQMLSALAQAGDKGRSWHRILYTIFGRDTVANKQLREQWTGLKSPELGLINTQGSGSESVYKLSSQKLLELIGSLMESGGILADQKVLLTIPRKKLDADLLSSISEALGLAQAEIMIVYHLYQAGTEGLSPMKLERLTELDKETTEDIVASLRRRNIIQITAEKIGFRRAIPIPKPW